MIVGIAATCATAFGLAVAEPMNANAVSLQWAAMFASVPTTNGTSLASGVLTATPGAV